ncbi:MAG: type II toxin-antitoxin system PemK/MazF family toxin [bacterium]
MKQGEIWLINLDPTTGAEIKKTRPAIVVNYNGFGKLPLRVIVPVTDWKEKYSLAPWMIKLIPDNINNLTKDSASDCFQVRSVSEKRFVKKIGEITKDQLETIVNALYSVFKIQR